MGARDATTRRSAMNEQTRDQVAGALATDKQTEGPMTRTPGRDLATGMSRTSTRRSALVGLLGLGLIVGGVPVLAAKGHGGHQESASVATTAETGQVTAEAG